MDELGAQCSLGRLTLLFGIKSVVGLWGIGGPPLIVEPEDFEPESIDDDGHGPFPFPEFIE